MDASSLRALIDDIASGACSPDDAVRQLRRLPYVDLGFARVDHHRDLRQGMPEAVYGPGKTPEHCAAIVEELLGATDGPVLLTRATDAQVKAVVAAAEALGYGPGIVTGSPLGMTSTVVYRPTEGRAGTVVVITAGTGDLPVANECTAVLSALGFQPQLLVDCGVAGLHRLLDEVDTIAMADAVVVIAGMEGALASVIGGLTPAPVIAVPTSTGYGAALEGVTALLAMLASCSSGVTVVGIDNGYGAACGVARLLP
ncbi:MAG TPA: nickel pincer cofactor biosynthesis protein LarB [Acidimicrobiales bacterium]|jgi:NCAIR mutase (PurE)-related protein|nr:nickel pincer cofactor biosynthesis protein LarB [Acidimicrobiales bacterium]